MDTTMIEIFSVIYLGNDELTPDKQLGTIKVDDNLHVHYLYNVDSVDMNRPSIRHGDQIMLMAPTIAPILGGITTFSLNLCHGIYEDCLNFANVPQFFEYEPLKRIIKSKDETGEICVLYSLFKDVTSANVDVKLNNINPTAQVYGVVAASTSMIESPEFVSILSLNKPEHTIKLAPGDRIPLSRSIVAVPLGSRLFLDVHLRDDENCEIVKGSVEFTAQSKTTVSSPQTIDGKKGQIVVNVNWKCAGLTRAERDIRDKNILHSVQEFFSEIGDDPDNDPDLSFSLHL